MVVGQFIDWVEASPAGRKAAAARALARACIAARPASDARAAMEAAITVVLAGARADVKQALAEAFADHDGAPRHVVAALAAEPAGIAACLYARSPLLVDGELIAALGDRPLAIQVAIASRAGLSGQVTARIASLCARDACLALLANPRATLDRLAMAALADRFGEDATVRDAILDRPDVPPEVHQALVKRVADTLGAFVSGKAWISEARAIAVTREATERATVAIATDAEAGDLPALVEHLRASEQLTTALILRAACSGHLDFFEAALAKLGGVPIERVVSLVAANRIGALRALYAKAGLPPFAFEAFIAALEVWGEVAAEGPTSDRYRTPVEVADAILDRYCRVIGETDADGTELAAVLRRFATDQARDAAHAYARAAA